MLIPDPDAWATDSLCSQVDPAVFLVGKGESIRPAKRLCQTCPVRPQCLATAMTREAGMHHQERVGVWGGLGPKERYRLDRGGRVLSSPA